MSLPACGRGSRAAPANQSIGSNRSAVSAYGFPVASGIIERDITADLKGALKVIKTKRNAAIMEPREAGRLINAIYSYKGQPYAAVGVKLSAVHFVRPGELHSTQWALH